MPRWQTEKPLRPATLADVGRAAGVSATAASAVLNQAQPRFAVTPRTRERILTAAAALSYRPNAAAQALARQRMHTLGVVAVVESGELNDYFLEVFSGILGASTRRQQNTTVFAVDNWRGRSTRLHDLCDGRVDGLILLAPTFGPAGVVVPADTPCVAIHANCEVPGVVNIESDEEHGAYAAVQHLVAQGHRRILHLTGPLGLLGAERRIRGYRRALADARIAAAPGWEIAAGYTTPGGREAVRRWLRSHVGQALPDAMFCANDAVAIGCLEALAEAGVRVPDEVSVVGFDDTYLARSIVPQLTSVRQPLAEIGARAVELLLAEIERPGPHPLVRRRPVVFPVELVARDSTGPVRATERRVGRWSA